METKEKIKVSIADNKSVTPTNPDYKYQLSIEIGFKFYHGR